MRYSAALRYLYSFLNFERLPFEYRRQFNLRRMDRLLDWFDRPERAFPSVLVAGTKGKGSTANFLSSIFAANRYSVGLYTSPHLNDPRERIRISGRAISKNDFARLISEIRPIVERRKKKQISSLGPVTFFEIFTLLAILYFAGKQVDLGIFEVGMGGRLDATNVMNQIVSIITPISFDHEEHLGETLQAIAHEKAAIIKRHACVICAKQEHKAELEIKRRMRSQKARAYWFGSEFSTAHERISPRGSTFDFLPPHPTLSPPGGERKGEGVRFQIQLPGRFQIQNAATALAAASVLEHQFGFRLKEPRIRLGLKTAFWPGRFEIVRRGRRMFILDCAHNGVSMREVCLSLKAFYPKRKTIAILGTSREKRLAPILKELLPNLSLIIVTKSDNLRAQEPKVILEKMSEMGYKKPAFWSSDIKEALKLASQVGSNDTVCLITGSLFLVAEAREALGCRNII